MNEEQRRARNRESTRRYRARHRERLLKERRTRSRKPCADCGGPKPPGKGIHRCPECQAAHKARLNVIRNEARRKPCRVCGKPKTPGRGRVACENCIREFFDKNTGRFRVFLADGRREFRYRLVMETHLGRPLRSDEHVHHINSDPTDDRIENLEILTPQEHGRIHGRWTAAAVAA